MNDLLLDRAPEHGSPVEHQVGVPRGVQLLDQNAAPVPEAAYEAADYAFDDPGALMQGDELHAALVAASPHIRIDELGQHIALLSSVLVDTPLIDERNGGLREGVDFAIQLLINRRKALARSIG